MFVQATEGSSRALVYSSPLIGWKCCEEAVPATMGMLSWQQSLHFVGNIDHVLEDWGIGSELPKERPMAQFKKMLFRHEGVLDSRRRELGLSLQARL